LRSNVTQMVKWPGKLYYGWRIIGLSMIVNAVGGGIYLYGFAIFFLPITRDLNLSRAATSLVFSLSRAEGALEGPLAGWLVDRFGPKYLLFVGAFFTGLGYILLSQIDSFAGFIIVYLGIISLAFNGGFSHTILAAVNTWFIRRRGLAMSTVISAFSLGGAILAPLLSFLILEFGWRTTSIIAGVAIWAFVLPAALYFKRSPESIGLRPDGDPVLTDDPAAEAARYPEMKDYTIREALKTYSYWVLALATALRLAVINLITVHFIPIMVWKGSDEPTAAALLGAMAFLSIPARLFLGWAGDKAPKNLIIAAGMVMGVMAFVILLFAESAWQIWVFVILFAVVEGVNPLNWALIGDFFGRTSFATLRGVMSLIYTIGTVASPVAAGLVFDETSSYTLVIWGMAVTYALGSLTFGILRAPHQSGSRTVLHSPTDQPGAPKLEAER